MSNSSPLFSSPRAPFSPPPFQLRLSGPFFTPEALQWRQRVLGLRQREVEARQDMVEQLQEAQREGWWRETGAASLKHFCLRELQIGAVETREILRRLGLILPAQALTSNDPLVERRIEALRKWRREQALSERIAAYRVFSNRTLLALAERAPTSSEQLLKVPGIGPAKKAAYGEAILLALASAII